jgi:hypothetical protein
MSGVIYVIFAVLLYCMLTNSLPVYAIWRQVAAGHKLKEN